MTNVVRQRMKMTMRACVLSTWKCQNVGLSSTHLEYNKEEEFCWRINKTRPKDGLIVEMTATLLKKRKTRHVNRRTRSLSPQLLLEPNQCSSDQCLYRQFISLQLRSIHNLVTILQVSNAIYERRTLMGIATHLQILAAFTATNRKTTKQGVVSGFSLVVRGFRSTST